jgi:hypothetical protein
MAKNLKRRGSSPQWMVVYLTHNVHEAQIVAGRLQNEGIPAMVHTVAGASALGIHIGHMGEVKVLVHPHNYHLALDILEPEEPEQLPDTTDPITFLAPDEEGKHNDNQ